MVPAPSTGVAELARLYYYVTSLGENFFFFKTYANYFILGLCLVPLEPSLGLLAAVGSFGG